MDLSALGTDTVPLKRVDIPGIPLIQIGPYRSCDEVVSLELVEEPGRQHHAFHIPGLTVRNEQRLDLAV